MNQFEYLVTLVSIVAGLGLTRALSGLARVVHDRRVSGVHVAWTGSVLLWLVNFWWFTFLFEPIETWTMPLLLFVLVYAAVIYFLIALLYPSDLETETDLFAYFLGDRRWFFGTFVVLGVLELADTWLKYTLLPIGLPPMVRYSLLMAAWISLGALGVVSENRLFHRAFAYSWVAVVGLWVGTRFELGAS